MILLGTEYKAKDGIINIVAPEESRSWIIFSREKLPINVAGWDARPYSTLISYLEAPVVPVVSSLTFEDIRKMEAIADEDGDKLHCPIRIDGNDYDFLLFKKPMGVLGIPIDSQATPSIYLVSAGGELEHPALIMSHAGWAVLQAPMTLVERPIFRELEIYE